MAEAGEEYQMSTAAIPKIMLNQKVRDFIELHHAEAVFERVCELIRANYPDLLDMRFWMQDDPDMDNRSCCMIGITLPNAVSQENRLSSWQQYHDSLVEEIPFASSQLFSLWESHTAV